MKITGPLAALLVVAFGAFGGWVSGTLARQDADRVAAERASVPAVSRPCAPAGELRDAEEFARCELALAESGSMSPEEAKARAEAAIAFLHAFAEGISTTIRAAEDEMLSRATGKDWTAFPLNGKSK